MTKLALYRFYNDGGQLLYTGITNDPERRFTEHAKAKHWWTTVRGISIDWYEDRESVLAAEKRAIRIERPLHNVRDRSAPLAGEGELGYEDLVYMEAAESVARDWDPPDGFWPEFNASVQAAIDKGYSYREIVDAAEWTEFDEEPDLFRYLPVYPGQMRATQIENLHDALNMLAAFLPQEVEQFRRLVKQRPEQARAHDYEVTILAADVAEQCAVTCNRDLELLSAHLDSLANRDDLLDRAQDITGFGAIFPMPRDCRTVIELAIACHLGTWPVDRAPTLASLRELVPSPF